MKLHHAIKPIFLALLLSQAALLSHEALEEHHEAETCGLCALHDRQDDALGHTVDLVLLTLPPSTGAAVQISVLGSRTPRTLRNRGPPQS